MKRPVIEKMLSDLDPDAIYPVLMDGQVEGDVTKHFLIAAYEYVYDSTQDGEVLTLVSLKLTDGETPYKRLKELLAKEETFFPFYGGFNTYNSETEYFISYDTVNKCGKTWPSDGRVPAALMVTLSNVAYNFTIVEAGAGFYVNFPSPVPPNTFISFRGVVMEFVQNA